MTKHFLPDELIFKAEYIRADDGAIMRDDGAGGFVRMEGTSTPLIEPTPVENKRRVFKRRNLSFQLMSRHNFRSGITAAFKREAVTSKTRGIATISPDIFSLWCGNKVIDMPTGVACSHFRFSNFFVVQPRVKRFICTMVWTPRSLERLPIPSFFALPQVIDDTEAAASNRARIAVYDAEFPTSEFPEHKIFGRASRNASPQYDEETLKSLGEYIDLCGSSEPMQSVFTAGQRVLEMEMRPSPEEMESIWNVPTIEYVTQMVRTSDMRLSEDGYLCNPISAYREMKIPAGGDVEYWVKSPKKLLSADKLRRRLRNQGIDEQEIDSEIELRARLQRVSFQDRGKSWTLCNIGGMQFAPLQHFKNGRIVYIGQLTDYGAYAAQDKLVQPQELECPGSDKKFWAPLFPRAKSNMALPVDVDSQDELQFDNHSEPPKYSEPHDDINPHVILERKQELAAYEGLLVPQSLRVMDSLLDLSKNVTQIGRAISDDQTLGEKTYERRGKKAVDAALEEIRKARQTLTATGRDVADNGSNRIPLQECPSEKYPETLGL